MLGSRGWVLSGLETEVERRESKSQMIREIEVKSPRKRSMMVRDMNGTSQR